MPLVGVKCPYHKRSIKFKECLQCALDNDTPCGFTYSLLRAGSVLLSKPRPKVHVTDLTGCLRRAYFGKVADYYEPPSQWIAAVLGIFIHSKLEEFAPPDSQVELSLGAITLSGVEVVGTVDLLTKDGVIVDSKSKRWLNKVRLPSSGNSRQINIYRWLLNENGYEANGGVLEYLALQGATRCRKCKCELEQKEDKKWICPKCKKEWDEEKAHRGTFRANVEIYSLSAVEKWVDERAVILDNALKLGTIAPKVSKAGEWVCSYCSFQKECKTFDELEKMKKEKQDD